MTTEELGSDDGISELLEKLGIVRTVNCRRHCFLYEHGSAQVRLESGIPRNAQHICGEESLSDYCAEFRVVESLAAGHETVS